jgi:hypothetical protein
MQVRRSAAIVGGVGLLGAWLASAAGLILSQPVPEQPIVAVPTSGAESLAEEVQAQSVRLRERLTHAPSPQPGGRNPFRFAPPRPVAVERRVAPVKVVETPAPVAAPPLLKLEGLAERDKNGVRTRIAVLSNLSEIVFAVEGDTIAGRYLVKMISADVVEIEEIGTGTITRLVVR